MQTNTPIYRLLFAYGGSFAFTKDYKYGIM